MRISGVRASRRRRTLKVSLNTLGGFRNEMTFVLTGLDIEAKADLVRRQLEAALTVKPAELEWTLARTDHPDADTEEAASALLRCVVRDPDPPIVGRALLLRRSRTGAGELSRASPRPRRPGDGQVYGVFTPGYVDAERGAARRGAADGTRADIAPATQTQELEPVADPRTARAAAVRRDPAGAARARSPARAAATRAATPTSACGCAPTSSGAGWPTR